MTTVSNTPVLPAGLSLYREGRRWHVLVTSINGLLTTTGLSTRQAAAWVAQQLAFFDFRRSYWEIVEDDLFWVLKQTVERAERVALEAEQHCRRKSDIVRYAEGAMRLATAVAALDAEPIAQNRFCEPPAQFDDKKALSLPRGA